MSVFKGIRIRKPQGIMIRIIQLLRPYSLRIAWGIVMIIIAQAIRMYFPLITRDVVNDVIPNRDFDLMWRLGLLLAGLTVIRATFSYYRGMVFERVSQDAVYTLRTELYRKFQAQSHTFYDTHRIGEIMSRMTGDMDGLRNFILNLCMSIGEQALMFILSIIYLWRISAPLAITTLATCVPLLAVAAVFNKRIRPAHAAVREQNATLNTRAQENIAGVRVVKAFAREAYESKMFNDDNTKARNLNMNATYIWSNFNPIMDVLGSLAVPALLLVGGLLVRNGSLDLGSLIAAMGYIWMLVNPMRMLAHFVNVVAQGLSSAEKLFYYLDLGSIVKNPESPVTPEKSDGTVEFDDVTFAYGDNVVLSNISLTAKPGETVAIMGATGSGKTSLVYLISRFYDIRSGSVKVDGVDVRDWDLKELRRRVGFVMQDTFLFSDSVEENIAFGRPGLAHEQSKRAADTSCATEFIEKLPAAWDTVVGERGLGLSGGQKQRVSIARAIAYEPRVLILDDATSAVDMETEAVIQEGLRDMRCTVFVIAHRISSVIKADQIIVLDGGKIAERGSHAELVERKGLYYDMFMDQVKDFAGLRMEA